MQSSGNVAVDFYQACAKRCQTPLQRRVWAKAEELLDLLRGNPDQTPPPFEKLIGDLTGAYSRRITIQHRLVYQILEEERTDDFLRMCRHYA